MKAESREETLAINPFTYIHAGHPQNVPIKTPQTSPPPPSRTDRGGRFPAYIFFLKYPRNLFQCSQHRTHLDTSYSDLASHKHLQGVRHNISKKISRSAQQVLTLKAYSSQCVAWEHVIAVLSSALTLQQCFPCMLILWRSKPAFGYGVINVCVYEHITANKRSSLQSVVQERERDRVTLEPSKINRI